MQCIGRAAHQHGGDGAGQGDGLGAAGEAEGTDDRRRAGNADVDDVQPRRAAADGRVVGDIGEGARYREFDEAEQLSREVGMRQRVLATAVDQTRRSRQVDFERRASDGTDANGDALVARLAAEAEVARVAYEKNVIRR